MRGQGPSDIRLGTLNENRNARSNIAANTRDIYLRPINFVHGFHRFKLNVNKQIKGKVKLIFQSRLERYFLCFMLNEL